MPPSLVFENDIIMKKYLVLLILMLTSFTVYAQDKVVLTSGKTIYVQVVETTNTELKFRAYDNLQGPILIEKLVNVYYVQYENGPMRIFNGSPARTNNYIPYQYSDQDFKSYSNQDLPSSGLTTQVDLFIQDAWGVGFMLRKEINKYIGVNIVGGSYMSGWNQMKSPNHYGQVNARLGGVRAYLPLMDKIRAYADVTLGYSYMYLNYNGIKAHHHFGSFDASAGFQLHKNFAIGYNLNFVVNGDGHATYHWGRISFLF